LYSCFGFIGAYKQVAMLVRVFAVVSSKHQSQNLRGDICATSKTTSMKKTLLALTVLAASGAAFSQVTITGTLGAGYRADSNVYKSGVNTGDTSGLGMDPSQVTFSASEDLGGGLKISAMMSIDGMTRAGVFGGDSALTLAGRLGSLTLETRKAPDFLSDDWVPMDERVFGKKGYSDGIAYKTPSFSGFSLVVAQLEDAGATVSNLGLGVGATGTPTGQRSDTYALLYAAGPLTAAAAVRTYDQSGVSVLPTSAATNPNKTLFRAKAAYDFGVAKVGGGMTQMTLARGTRTSSLLGVSVPFKSLTLVADVANQVMADTGYGDGTTSGYGLSAVYALSKRTSITALYASWDGAIGAPVRSTRTELLLVHNF